MSIDSATVDLNLCRIFQLPRQIVCLSQPTFPPLAEKSIAQCRSKLNVSHIIASSDNFVCYNGSIRNLLSNNDMRELMLKAVALEFPYTRRDRNISERLFPSQTFQLANIIRRVLLDGINDNVASFIAVHWRRSF